MAAPAAPVTPTPDPDPTTQLASKDDLADVLGRPLTTDEDERADRRLLKAQSLVGQRVRNLLDRVEAWPSGPAAIDPDVAAEVIATIVARQWRNPEGALNRTVTVGPYTEGVGYGERVGGEQVGRGELVVTQSDVAKLTAPPPFAIGGTIRTVAQPPFADGCEITALGPGC